MEQYGNPPSYSYLGEGGVSVMSHLSAAAHGEGDDRRLAAQICTCSQRVRSRRVTTLDCTHTYRSVSYPDCSFLALSPPSLCTKMEKMTRVLPLNPTFIPPTYGVLKSLLENPLKLPLHHDDGITDFSIMVYIYILFIMYINIFYI